MNNNQVQLDFVANVQQTIANLNALNSSLLQNKDLQQQLRDADPFGTLATNMRNYNTNVAEGAKAYMQIQNSAAAYRAEVTRLQALEKDLIKAQLEFSNSQKYDAATAQLAIVRNRIAEVQAGLRTMGVEGKNSGKAIGDGMSEASSQTNGLLNFLNNVKTALISFFALNKFKEIASDIFDARSNAESFGIALETMVQSKTVATALEAQIVDLAKKTPFTLKDVQEQTKSLLAYGISAKDVVGDIKTLGDISAGVGAGKLPQLTLAYGQVRAAGHLMGQELRQFTEAGVPLLEALGTAMGKSVAEIQSMVHNGQIGFNDVREALQGLTSEGGRFFNLMEKQSTTLEGKWSNLTDSLYQGWNNLGKVFQGSAKTGIDALGDLINSLLGSDSAVRRTVDGMKTLASAVATYTIAVNASTIADAVSAGWKTALTMGSRALTIAQGTLALAFGATTVAEYEAGVAAKAFWTALAANPLGLIITLVGSAVTAYMAFRTINDEVTSSLDENVKSIAKENIGLNALVNAYTNSNASLNEKKAILKQIREQYPDFLRHIDDNAISEEFLRKKMAETNKEFEKRIQLAVINAKVDAKKNQLTEASKGDDEIINDYNKNRKTEDKIYTVDEIIRRQKQEDKAQGNHTYQTSMGGNAPLLDLSKAAEYETIHNKVLNDQKGLMDDIVGYSKVGLKISADIAKVQEETYQTSKRYTEENKKQYDLLTKKESAAKKEGKEYVLSDSEKKFKQTFQDNQGKVVDYENQNKEAPKGGPTQKQENDAAKAAQKLREDMDKEHQKLIADEKKWQDELSKIQLEGDNVRLSLMDKNSEEYIRKKAEYDKEVVESERKKWLEIYDLEKGEVVQKYNPTTKKMEAKTLKFSEIQSENYQKQGKTKEEADKQAQDDLSNTFNSDSKNAPAIDTYNLKNQLITKKSDEEILKLREDQANKLLSLQSDSLDKEIETIERKFEQEQKAYADNADIIEALEKKKSDDIQQAKANNAHKVSDSNKSLESAKLDEEESAGLAKFGNKNTAEIDGTLITKADFEEKMKQKRLDIQIKYAQESIAIEKALLQARIEMSDEDRAIAEKKIKTAELELATIQNKQKTEQKGYENTKKSFKDMTSLMDLLGNKEDNNKDSFHFFDTAAEQKDAEFAVTTIKSSLNTILSAEEQASRARISLYDQQLSERETQLSTELEKQKSGLANSVDAKRAEVNALRDAREQEKEHLKKIQKEKAVIDSAEIASQEAVTLVRLLSAAATQFDNGMPLVGIALAIAAIVSMYASFASIKAKFAAAATLRKGAKLEKGRSHEEGGMNVVDSQTGELLYNIEKGEYLMGTDISTKHGDALEHINRGTMRNLSHNEQRRLLEPLGIKFLTNSQNNVSKTYESLREYQRSVESHSTNDYLDKLIATHLKGILDHTSRIGNESEYVENGVVLHKKNGKIVTIEQNAILKKAIKE